MDLTELWLGTTNDPVDVAIVEDCYEFKKQDFGGYYDIDTELEMISKRTTLAIAKTKRCEAYLACTAVASSLALALSAYNTYRWLHK